MVGLNENYAGVFDSDKNDAPVAVDLPSHLPVQRVFLHRVWKGDVCWVLLSDERARVLGLLATRHTPKLGELLKRMEFAGPATRCAYTENLFDVGYAMITYDAAQWLTREVRTVLNTRPHIKALLAPNHGIKSVWGGKVS